MPKENGPQRYCSDCGKWYLRGNRFRVWRLKLENGKIVYSRLDTKLCTVCLDKREVATVLKITSAHMEEQPHR